MRKSSIRIHKFAESNDREVNTTRHHSIHTTTKIKRDKMSVPNLFYVNFFAGQRTTSTGCSPIYSSSRRRVSTYLLDWDHPYSPVWRDLRGLRLLAQPKDCYPACPSATTMNRSIVQKLGKGGPRVSNNHSGDVLYNRSLGFTTTSRSISMSETRSPPRASRSRISDCEQELLAQGQPRWERTFGSTVRWGSGTSSARNRRFDSIIPNSSRRGAHDQRLVPTSWDRSDGFFVTGTTMTIRVYRFQLHVSTQSNDFNVADQVLSDYSCEKLVRSLKFISAHMLSFCAINC